MVYFGSNLVWQRVTEVVPGVLGFPKKLSRVGRTVLFSSPSTECCYPFNIGVRRPKLSAAPVCHISWRSLTGINVMKWEVQKFMTLSLLNFCKGTSRCECQYFMKMQRMYAQPIVLPVWVWMERVNRRGSCFPIDRSMVLLHTLK